MDSLKAHCRNIGPGPPYGGRVDAPEVVEGTQRGKGQFKRSRQLRQKTCEPDYRRQGKVVLKTKVEAGREYGLTRAPDGFALGQWPDGDEDSQRRVIMARTALKLREPRQNENDAFRLRRSTATEVMSVELVSAFAGDRELTKTDHDLIRSHRKSRGDVFFSDLLYTISHLYFAPERAETLWHKILAHKSLVSKRLGRNVRITVATLDYLSNITSELRTPTLISEAHVSEIASLAMRDGMTGLFNHSTCHELLELELRNYRRYGVGVSLLLLDIDDFKSVNDRKGHQEGDRILVELAKALTEEARDTDICCRLGGDEFVVILRRTNDSRQACRMAERIRVKAATIAGGGQQMAISVGVALCDPATTSSDAFIERADQALHRAKMDGKNQVILAARNRPKPVRGQASDWRTRPIASLRPCRGSSPSP